jgi:hypothetical protein
MTRDTAIDCTRWRSPIREHVNHRGVYKAIEVEQEIVSGAVGARLSRVFLPRSPSESEVQLAVVGRRSCVPVGDP